MTPLEKLGHEHPHHGQVLRASLLSWLDIRDRILCHLSADDGEWEESTGDVRKWCKDMDGVMRLAKEQAKAVVEDWRELLRAILSEQATLHGYTTHVNWSIDGNVKETE